MAERNNAKYPWARWFAQPSFAVRHGVDFACSPEIMRMQIHNAKRRFVPGRRVEVRIDGGVPAVLFVEVKPRSRRAAATYGGPSRRARSAA